MRHRIHARRRGAAAVEFAIVAPVMFLTLLALMQFAGLLMSKNVLTNAAREGGRVASMPSTVSTATVVTTVKDYLSRGGVSASAAEVSVSPTTWSDVNSGDDVRVSVSIPLNKASWIWAIAPPSVNVSAEVTYKRE